MIRFGMHSSLWITAWTREGQRMSHGLEAIARRSTLTSSTRAPASYRVRFLKSEWHKALLQKWRYN
jgi:hypothetical protein